MNFGDFTKSYHIVDYENYHDGDVIFNEGTPGDWIYVVVKGVVEIFKEIRGKKIVVDNLKEGDLFGEVGFIDKNPRSAGARAVGETTVGLFDKDYLTQEYNKLPNNFRVIFDAMARRLRKMTNVATNLAGGQTQSAAPHPVELNFSSVEDFFKAYSPKIGGGGFFLTPDALLSTPLEVALRFNLPGQKAPISARGRLARQTADPAKGLGVQLTGLNPKDKERLVAFLKKSR